MIRWKVVHRNTYPKALRSCSISKGIAMTIYEPRRWTEAPLLRYGWGIHVFNDERDAKYFLSNNREDREELWLCEVYEDEYLPPRMMLPDGIESCKTFKDIDELITKGLINPWMKNAEMYQRVKLLERVILP